MQINELQTLEKLNKDVKDTIEELFCAQESVMIFQDSSLVYTQNIEDDEITYGADENGDLLLRFDTNEKMKIIYILSNAGIYHVTYEIFGDKKPTLSQFVLQAEAETTVDIKVNMLENTELDLYQFVQIQNVNMLNLNNTINFNTHAKLNLRNVFSASTDFTYQLDANFLESFSQADVLSININHQHVKHRLSFLANHLVEDTSSEFKVYHIAKNDSETYVKTNGTIKRNAKRTSAQHNTKGIIIDKKSIIQADPLLMIDEYDVVAGHGASIGDLDESEIFYLMSRGLTKEESERMIISGLVAPVLSGVTDDYIIDYVEKRIMKLL